MDDIAAALGISKRTLYETVQSREELMKMCYQHYGKKIRSQFEAICSKECSSTFERILSLNEVFIRNTHSTHKSFLEEVRKFGEKDPKRGEYNELQFKYFERLLREGQTKTETKEAEIQPDLCPCIMARLMVAQLKALVQDQMFNYSEFSFFDTYKLSWRIFLNGIATEYGRSVIEKWVTADSNRI